MGGLTLCIQRRHSTQHLFLQRITVSCRILHSLEKILLQNVKQCSFLATRMRQVTKSRVGLGVLKTQGHDQIFGKIRHRQNWPIVQTTCNSEKCKKYGIRFMGKFTLIRRDFQTLNAGPARTAFSLNVHQFCKPKYSCFMRETAVKRIPFFLEFLMLYEVYMPKTIT